MDPEQVPVLTSWILLPTLVVSLVLSSLLPVIAVNLMIYAVFVYGLIRNWIHTDHLPMRIGIPNVITVLRGSATILVFLTYPFLDPIVVSVSLSFLYLLDKADGVAAKVLDQKSRIGELMDVETDALLTVYLLFWLYFEEKITAVLLVIAFLRYVYVIILDNVNLPVKRESRKQFSAIVSTVFIYIYIWYWSFPLPIIEVAGYLAAGLIGFTFIRDFYHRLV